MLPHMGTDIHGFVEVWNECYDFVEPDDEDFSPYGWHPAIGLDHLYDGRSYAAFGCLFGVRGTAFTPLAADRGLPEGVSSLVESLCTGDADSHSPTWISWAELEAADWDEPSPDIYPYEYRRGPSGEWQRTGLADPGRWSARRTGVHAGRFPDSLDEWPEGTEWVDGDRLVRVARSTRRDAVPDCYWGDLWTVMRTLARRHGSTNVRLVVWFDN